MSLLAGCPFCGEIPEIHRWHGGGPQKTVVNCRRDACEVQPSVCRPTRRKAVAAWNKRQRPQVTSAELVPYTDP